MDVPPDIQGDEHYDHQQHYNIQPVEGCAEGREIQTELRQLIADIGKQNAPGKRAEKGVDAKL